MSIDYAACLARARDAGLDIFGTFDAGEGDGLPEGSGTVLLLGPREPGFWERIVASDEYRDGNPDPVDRWSRRAVGRMACDLGGKAYFPFGGPPHRPFIAWALRSGRAWVSPAHLLVHDTAGLLVSYRGAIALRQVIDTPHAGPSPCDSCAERPCLAACPAGAISGAGYDIEACRGYLGGAPGSSCMEGGCLARRACPVSQGYSRDPRQSAHHMRHFLG